MPHIIRLVQSGSSLYDFQSASVNVLSRWSPAPYDHKVKVIDDAMVLNPKGSTIAGFYDNLNTLYRAIHDAEENYSQSQLGMPYTPIYLRFQQDGATNAVQSEVFGGETGEIENFISGALRAKLIHNLPFKLKRRPYFEETAAQALFNTTVSNDMAPAAISGIRGDLPAPLKISVQAGSGNQDRIIIGVKAKGTIANFVPKYQAESYASRGSGVADRVDTDMSGDAGQRWTPPAGAVAADQELLTWTITSNVADQLGTYRVYVRCHDNAATTNARIRVRAGVNTSTNVQWGDYGDSAKYSDGTYTAGASPPGTATTYPLVDCGIIKLPAVDTNGVTPVSLSIQLRGQVIASGVGTFDIDEIFLMPTQELPYGGGFQTISFPEDMGNATDPLGYADASDRVPRGYLDSAGVLQNVAADVRGRPLYGWTNKSMRVYILTQKASSLVHTEANTNTVVITATPRYHFARGS